MIHDKNVIYENSTAGGASRVIDSSARFTFTRKPLTLQSRVEIVIVVMSSGQLLSYNVCSNTRLVCNFCRRRVANDCQSARRDRAAAIKRGSSTMLSKCIAQWLPRKTVRHAEVAAEELSQFGWKKYVLRARGHDPLEL